MTEKSEQEWRARLRRLGVVKGVRSLKPARPSPAAHAGHARRRSGAGDLDALLPGGRLEETDVGACFILDKVYPLSHWHGTARLGTLLEHSPAPAGLFCADPRLATLAFRDFVFLDTETTGLAGAGTLAFMVGVAFFEPSSAGDVLIVRQYFLRDHADEAAMLQKLDELLAAKVGLVTFNGRSFDVPLLDGRYLMNRMPGRLLDLPHIDLLPPARRLWRYRLDSCALVALEQDLLGIRRTHDDVPGWLIPGLYHDYLRSGDARELVRVFYHNRIDLLTMITLLQHVTRQFAQPAADDNPLDLLSLGRWQAALGLHTDAEENLRLALAADLPLEYYHQLLQELSLMLKRNARREEALPLWQQWASSSFDSVDAHVELAKHYEWHTQDIDAAIEWTQRALRLIDSWSPYHARLVRDELDHRLARLMRKR